MPKKKDIEDFIQRLVLMKQESINLELLETHQHIDEAIKVVGFEYAKKITKRNKAIEEAKENLEKMKTEVSFGDN